METLVVLFAVIANQLVAAAPAQVPGYTGPQLSIDTGYITVDDIKLFYFHVASQKTPATDPLVFWYQGGPGGPGLVGAFLEMGPFRIINNSSVVYNPLTWLEAGANMVFIDQPACVGFSYSSNLADCNSSDTQSAAVNVRAVKEFLFKVMPQYQNRKFWFSGESYAGAYVPMLSALVVDDPQLRGNFAGFLVGNPVMECYRQSDPQDFGVGDTWSYFNQLYWNGYVDQDSYEQWRVEGCDSESHRHGKDHPVCDAILNRVSTPALLGADFNPDDNFDDFCTGNGTLSFATSLCNDNSDSTWAVWNAYLSQQSVANAFHADISFNQKFGSFNYTANAQDKILDYYLHILQVKPSVKILVYSGLSDVWTVPFSYTMPCVHQLMIRANASVKVPWKLWHPNPSHHGGHWQQWTNNVTYATIRGAGHEVPMYQPYLAFVMFDRFLHTYGLAD